LASRAVRKCSAYSTAMVSYAARTEAVWADSITADTVVGRLCSVARMGQDLS
jgi:hypothetical protein